MTHILLASLTMLALASSSLAQTDSSLPPVSVMIVGTFHMANPGRDLHNMDVSDVLLPAAQKELDNINGSLLKFGPTKVMTEWPADLTNDRFTQYVAGTLPPSHNEVVQMGFRLAKAAGLKHVYGIDVDGDFPYEPVQAFAQSHGKVTILEHANSEMESQVQAQTAVLQSRGITATLQYLNDPVRLKHDNSFYRRMLYIGAGPQQPGADLLTAWYRRNLLICSNIVQNSRPGDHIVIFYGAGHAFLLRQCVEETPGFTLIEPNSFLQR